MILWFCYARQELENSVRGYFFHRTHPHPANRAALPPTVIESRLDAAALGFQAASQRVLAGRIRIIQQQVSLQVSAVALATTLRSDPLRIQML